MSVPVGSTLTRVFYTVANGHGYIGTEFEVLAEASITALEEWAKFEASCAITPPTVVEYWVMTHPDGSGTTMAVQRSQVAPHLTTNVAGKELRGARAQAAISNIRSHMSNR